MFLKRYAVGLVKNDYVREGASPPCFHINYEIMDSLWLNDPNPEVCNVLNFLHIENLGKIYRASKNICIEIVLYI